MGATEPATPFRYEALPADVAPALRRNAEEIRALATKRAVGLVRIGLLLADARGRCKARTFRRWIGAELPYSRATCYRLISIGQAFGPLIGDEDSGVTARIDAMALVLLARPEVPPEAREAAVQLANKQRLTVADARQILAVNQRGAELESAEVSRHENRVRRIIPGMGANPEPVDPAPFWNAIKEMFSQGATLHIGPIDESDAEFAPLASVTVYHPEDRPRNHVRRRLEDAVLAAANMEPEKTCPSCSETKPIGLFGDNDKEDDGRNRYCRECEKTRLLKIKHKLRDAKRAAALNGKHR